MLKFKVIIPFERMNIQEPRPKIYCFDSDSDFDTNSASVHDSDSNSDSDSESSFDDDLDWCEQRNWKKMCSDLVGRVPTIVNVGIIEHHFFTEEQIEQLDDLDKYESNYEFKPNYYKGQRDFMLVGTTGFITEEDVEDFERRAIKLYDDVFAIDNGRSYFLDDIKYTYNPDMYVLDWGS
jgi:hypothetical protein